MRNCAGEGGSKGDWRRWWWPKAWLMRRAATLTGLKTTVNVIRRIYPTGRKVAEDFKADTLIRFDHLLPMWNYMARPDR